MIFYFEHLTLVGGRSNNFGSGGICLHLGTWFSQLLGKPGIQKNCFPVGKKPGI